MPGLSALLCCRRPAGFSALCALADCGFPSHLSCAVSSNESGPILKALKEASRLFLKNFFGAPGSASVLVTLPMIVSLGADGLAYGLRVASSGVETARAWFRFWAGLLEQGLLCRVFCPPTRCREAFEDWYSVDIVELSRVKLVDGPRFTAVKQSGENN